MGLSDERGVAFSLVKGAVVSGHVARVRFLFRLPVHRVGASSPSNVTLGTAHAQDRRCCRI